jgi:hypothetical protein
MAIDIKKVQFPANLPEVPDRVDVVRVAPAHLEERRQAIALLTDRLQLGRTREISTSSGRIWASKRGDVEFYEASGGLWSRDLTASEAHENELREWPDLGKVRDAAGDTFLTLGARAAAQASDLASEVAKLAGFDLACARPPRVDLTQVASLSEDGKVLQSGAGEASIVFDYALEGLPVLGAGAKTAIDFEPAGSDLRLVGAFHVWRRPLERRHVEIGSLEAALNAGLLRDPHLMAADKKGGRITIGDVRFGLLALPATARQDYLFPALAVTGRVDLRDDKLGHVRFGRYYHAATPSAYTRADVLADYLVRAN